MLTTLKIKIVNDLVFMNDCVVKASESYKNFNNSP